MLNKIVILTIVSVFSLGINVFGQSITRLDKTKISATELDKKIEFLMKAANVHGLAVTVFNNNNPVYKKTFGYKRLDTKAPISSSTNFLWSIVKQSGVCRTCA